MNDFILWTPVFSFLVFVVIYAMGDWVCNLTQSKVSSLLVCMILYLIGFQTGIIPADSISSTGLPTAATNFGSMLILVGMGTMINTKQLADQWKTVVIALVGLVGLAICSFTINVWIFGRDWALTAAAPISGGLMSGLMTSEAAVAAGKPKLAAFAMLIIGLQGFVGIPICNTFLRRYCYGILNGKIQIEDAAKLQTTQAPKQKLLHKMPKWMTGDTTIIAKMTLIGWLGFTISKLCSNVPVLQNFTSANILYLVFGIIFCLIGFLPSNAHFEAHINGFLLIAMVSMLPGSLSTLSLADLLEMLVPLIGTLVIGAVFICIFGAIAAKMLGVHRDIAIAISICCTLGYPSTQIMVDEVTRNLKCDEKVREKIYDHVMPPIIVSGFVSCTIASVIFAGILCPLIF